MNKTWITRPIILPLVVLTGVLIVIVAKQLKAPPHTSETQARGTAANVMTIKASSIQPTVTGYGTVKPSVVVNLVAEVSGRIIWRNPQLDAGTMLAAGTDLLRLDDTDYQLALRQAEANIAMAKAQRAQLESTRASVQQSLRLAQQRLGSVRKELQRKQALLKQGSLPQSQVDAEQRAYLQAEQEVISLQQQLSTLPAQLDVAIAQQAIAEAQASQQQRNIDRTLITLPFDARIALADINEGQFAAPGQLLVQAQGVDAVDIEAQFTLDQLRPFLQALSYSHQAGTSESAANNATSEPPQGLPPLTPGDNQAIQRLISMAGITAQVELPFLGPAAGAPNWQARVITFRESLDPQTRTLAVVVRIDQPYEQMIPGQRPPLISGLNARITLSGKPILAIAIPATALHVNYDNGSEQTLVYRLDQQNRLQRQPVSPLLGMGDISLLPPTALPAGAALVLSDLTPAIDGMLIEPMMSEARLLPQSPSATDGQQQ